MAFSGEHISTSFIAIADSVIQSEGFSLNKEKTKLVRGSGKKIVTGISISGECLTIPKQTKRKLRQDVHYLTTLGFFEHTHNIKEYDPLYVERLLGRLSFWKQIEPKNAYVSRSIAKIRSIQKQLDSL
jgi:hypothetical protein